MGTVDDDARKAAKREYQREWKRRYRAENPEAREKQRAADRRYHAANRERRNAKSAAYQQANRERIREQQRAYNDKNRAAKQARERAYYAANKESKLAQQRVYYAANRAVQSARQQRWREANPDAWRDQIARKNRARKARRAGVVHESWTTREILERDGWLCQIDDCRCPDGRGIDPDVRYSLWEGVADHIHPISKGGPDTPDNLQAAHRSCNAVKGSRVD